MPRSGPRQIYKYSKEFKLSSVRVSHVPGIQLRAVATTLGIHPFMLSERGDHPQMETVRAGAQCRGPDLVCEIARLQEYPDIL